MILQRFTVCATIISVCGLMGQSWAEDKLVAKTMVAYPGYEKPSCLTQLHSNETTDAYKKGTQAAEVALQQPYDSATGVWNQEMLSNKSHLRDAITSFLKGDKGKSVRQLKLAGKKPDELHQELIAAGFQHERMPLMAPKQDKEYKYWRRDGTKTSNAQDSQVVPIDIYAHADGGLVRVKPEGIPSPKYVHAAPQATKSVVYNTSPKGDKLLDTRYPNEAFRITDDGRPLPKSPSSKAGLRLLVDRKDMASMKEAEAQTAKQELKGWTQTIMNASYIDLAADYAHCPKDDVKADHQNKTTDDASATAVKKASEDLKIVDNNKS